MIVNTGARTDIPAFFSEWFDNRLRAGFVCVRSPYAPQRVARYRLDPGVVDALLFCTKNPRPILSRLDRIDRFASYWYVTITPYGRDIEPSVPRADAVIEDFKILSRRYGSTRLAWRYDPVLLTERHTIAWHKRAFAGMAERLAGYTDTCIVSFITLYAKTRRNFPAARRISLAEKREIASAFAGTGARFGMRIKTCAEAANLCDLGIDMSGCLSRETLERALGRPLKALRGTPARECCRC